MALEKVTFSPSVRLSALSGSTVRMELNAPVSFLQRNCVAESNYMVTSASSLEKREIPVSVVL